MSEALEMLSDDSTSTATACFRWDMTRDRPTIFSILILLILPAGILIERALGATGDPTALILAAYALAHALLSYLDNRELRAAGATDRTIWPWAILLAPIYLWVRTRAIGGSYAHIALWVASGLIALAIAANQPLA